MRFAGLEFTEVLVSPDDADARKEVLLLLAPSIRVPCLTHDVALNAPCSAYCKTIMGMPEMKEWVAAARLETNEIEELEMDF